MKPTTSYVRWPATGATSRYLLSWSRTSRASATRRCHFDGAASSMAAASAATGLGEADIARRQWGDTLLVLYIK